MKKEILRIGVIFAVTVGVVLWGLNFIFFNQNAPKSKATGETMNLSFTPLTQIAAANTDFTVTIFAKPSINTVLRGYKTKVNFDKTKLAFKLIQYKVGVVSAELGNTTADVATVNSNGFVDVVGEDTTATGYVSTAANGAELVSLTFTALSATGTSVSMSDSSFYSINADTSLFDGWTVAAQNLDVNGGGTTGGSCTSFSDDFSAATLNTTNWQQYSNNNGTVTIANGQVIISNPTATATKLTQINGKNTVSGDFTAEETLLSVETDGNKIAGSVEFSASNYGGADFFRISRYSDNTNIFAINIVGNSAKEDGVVNVGLTPSTPIKVKMQRTGNKADMYYDLLDGQGYKLIKTFNNVFTGPITLETFVLNFQPDYPQVTAKFDDFKLTCPDQGGTGNVNLKMKLKFQGINKLPATGQNSIAVKVKLYKEGVSAPTDGTGTFTADASGVWSGTVPVNLTAVTGKYKVLIKGPQHIQKKICDSTPSETSPGIYRCSDGNITLAVGDNNLDLSGIIMLVGDLDQNGIVDSVDFGLVKNNLGKTDAETLAKADLNRDGVVDTQDYSLILAALAVRVDEL